MTKVNIKNDFYKKIASFSRLERLVLCFVQQNFSGVQKISHLSSNNKHSRLAKTIENLANSHLKVCGSPIKIFEKLTYNHGTVSWKFTPEVASLIQNSRGYFEMDIEVYKRLRSNKACLLYANCCQFATGNLDRDLYSFKALLGATGKVKYSSFNAFRRFVLDPAIKQVEKHTPFRFRTASSGQTFVTYTNAFGKRRIQMKWFEAVPAPVSAPKQKQLSLYERLLEKGVHASIALNAVRKLGEEYLNKLVYTVLIDTTDGGVKNQSHLLMHKISKALALLEYNSSKIKPKQKKTGTLKDNKPKQPTAPMPPKKNVLKAPIQRIVYDTPRGESTFAELLKQRLAQR